MFANVHLSNWICEKSHYFSDKNRVCKFCLVSNNLLSEKVKILQCKADRGVARLTAMREASGSNPASYLCCNMHQEFSRCSTRLNLRECTSHMHLPSAIYRIPTLAKPRGDVTRSPKQVYQWSHEKDLCPPKIKKKRLFNAKIKSQSQ